jgi:hypothetical protein
MEIVSPTFTMNYHTMDYFKIDILFSFKVIYFLPIVQQRWI